MQAIRYPAVKRLNAYTYSFIDKVNEQSKKKLNPESYIIKVDNYRKFYHSCEKGKVNAVAEIFEKTVDKQADL